MVLMSSDLTAHADDAELAARIAAAADREAETELFRRMAPRIRLFGLRRLRNEDAAADLVQQTMITVLKALREGKLREPARIASFVLGACRMSVLEIHRGGRRRERLLEQFARDTEAWQMPAPPVLDHHRLTRCVQRLKERERAVVVMTFYDEQTGGDVARFLGVSETNVRVIRHRAIHHLRICMGAAA